MDGSVVKRIIESAGVIEAANRWGELMATERRWDDDNLRWIEDKIISREEALKLALPTTGERPAKTGLYWCKLAPRGDYANAWWIVEVAGASPFLEVHQFVPQSAWDKHGGYPVAQRDIIAWGPEVPRPPEE
jgi:hypothetical protein